MDPVTSLLGDAMASWHIIGLDSFLFKVSEFAGIEWNQKKIYDPKKGDCRVLLTDGPIGWFVEGDVSYLIKTLYEKGEEGRGLIRFLSEKIELCNTCKGGENSYHKKKCDKSCRDILEELIHISTEEKERKEFEKVATRLRDIPSKETDKLWNEISKATGIDPKEKQLKS